MKRLCIFAAGALVIFLAVFVCALAQNTAVPPQSSASNPSAHSAALPIVLDVVVTDHGHAVPGLAREAFHVFEDGREQSVKLFEEHKAEIGSAEAPPQLPPHVYSNFPDLPATSAANVLLLDAMNTPIQDQAYVRKQMIEYLKSVPANSYMAIFVLGNRLRLVQGFISQPELLAASLQNPGQSSPLLATATRSAQNAVALAVVREFQNGTEAFLQINQRVRNTLDVINQLAGYLAAIPGRKNLIWLSGSFPISLDPDLTRNPILSPQEYQTLLKQTSGRLTEARVAVYPIDVRGLLFGSDNLGVAGGSSPLRGGFSSGGSGMAVTGPGAARTARGQGPASVPNTSPDSFSGPGSAFEQRTSAEEATMRQIAEQTGGLAFYENNSIKEALGRAVENGASYYTLAYIPENKNLDGAFRQIRVELANKQYHVSCRRGYFADAKNASAASPLTPAASVIQRGAPPSSQILFKVLVLPADDPKLAGMKSQPGPAGVMGDKLKGPVKRYWIDFVVHTYHVDFASDKDGLRHASLEVVSVAYDHDGGVLNAVNRSYNLRLQPAQYDKLVQSGMPVHEELDLPAGEVYLRVGVHDLSTDHIGTMEIPLQVTAQ